MKSPSPCARRNPRRSRPYGRWPTEIMRAIFGVDKHNGGTVTVNGSVLNCKNQKMPSKLALLSSQKIERAKA